MHFSTEDMLCRHIDFRCIVHYGCYGILLNCLYVPPGAIIHNTVGTTKWLKALRNCTGHTEMSKSDILRKNCPVSQCVSSEHFSGLNDLCSQVVGISWDQQ